MVGCGKRLVAPFQTCVYIHVRLSRRKMDVYVTVLGLTEALVLKVAVHLLFVCKEKGTSESRFCLLCNPEFMP